MKNKYPLASFFPARLGRLLIPATYMQDHISIIPCLQPDNNTRKERFRCYIDQQFSVFSLTCRTCMIRR